MTYLRLMVSLKLGARRGGLSHLTESESFVTATKCLVKKASWSCLMRGARILVRRNESLLEGLHQVNTSIVEVMGKSKETPDSYTLEQAHDGTVSNSVTCRSDLRA